MMNNTCIVVIPVYKEKASLTELASFRQCLSVLKNHDICIITFKELNLNEYRQEAIRIGKDYDVEYFDKSYFTSVTGYNKLCLTKEFYERFVQQYEYMLIYQLDAWVFSDELQYWCDKGYDYIGAPWFKNISADEDNPVYTMDFEGVGNGGFTLRRIKYCIETLSCSQYIPYIKPDFLWRMAWHKQKRVKGHNVIFAFVVALFITILRTCGFRNTFYWYLHSKSKQPNEDYILSIWSCHSNLIKCPRIPNVMEAASFSFEVHPSFLYGITKALPFGCHAFRKWEYDEFWSKYIKL